MENLKDDDDFDIRPAKIPKFTDCDKNPAEACTICMEAFTTCGDHKLVSLKCGHTFGQKCILMWINGKNSVCPCCKSTASKNDIRPIFLDIPAIKMEDNSEFNKTLEELHAVKIKLRENELTCSHLLAQCNSYVTEMKKLRDENEILKQRNISIEHQYKSSEKIPSQSKRLNFKIFQKLQISAIGDCRVMAFSELTSQFCISSPSPNSLYPGFGIRLVNARHVKMMKFLHLHSKMVRDIAFSPNKSSDLMLTCSLDKYVKLTNLKVEKTVASYLCSAPVWSCAWSSNNNQFYAGLCNGNVEELDTRNLSSPVSSIWSQSGGPVLSMRYISSSHYIDNNGLIVSNSQNVLFLDKSILVTDSEKASIANSSSLIKTLVLSKNYGGSLIHSTYNDRTSHLLSTFRPGDDNKSQFLLSQIGTTEINDVDSVYATDARSYYGGSKKDYMHRSCFVDDGTSESYVVCPDEESCSIKVWDSNSDNDCVSLYPTEVTRTKPIVDVCQYQSDPLSFAAINCNNLYLYTQ